MPGLRFELELVDQPPSAREPRAQAPARAEAVRHRLFDVRDAGAVILDSDPDSGRPVGRFIDDGADT